MKGTLLLFICYFLEATHALDTHIGHPLSSITWTDAIKMIFTFTVVMIIMVSIINCCICCDELYIINRMKNTPLNIIKVAELTKK